jgi:hypothetical protein
MTCTALPSLLILKQNENILKSNSN